MIALNWIKGHKLRAALIAIAAANAFYFLWCAAADRPSTPLAKLILPFIVLPAVMLNRTERRARN